MNDVNDIPDGWTVEILVNCLESLIDYRGKTPKKSDSGILTLSAKSVKMGYIDYSQAYYISAETYKSFMVRGFPKVGDVLMTTEAPLGCIARLDRDDVGIAQRLLTLRGAKNVLDNDYLRYYLTSRRGQHELNSRASGSTVQGIKRTEFEKIEIILPEYEEQKAIAKILTAFDNKIENLQSQNKTLEQTAQTIFEEWFGKFQIGDVLPDSWRVFGMNELVETINGYSYKGKELVQESDEALVTLKSFDRNGGFQTRGFKPFKGTPKETQEVQIGDLVVAHTDLTQDAEVLGNPAFIFDNGGYNKMYITMDLVKVNPLHKDISSSFLYYLMKDRRFKGHCVGYSNGTTVLHLSKKAIPEYRLPLPKDFEKVKEFSAIANSTTSKISLNKDALKSLGETRDTLLPKLMSGQIRVNDFKD
jgi:type I restriction enzyme S subunit